MPRAPGPLPPWAREIVAALRFLGQHLARLRHQLGRQLAKVARRGPKRLAIGAPVLVQRSSGQETIGYVVKRHVDVDAGVEVYMVELLRRGSGAFKRVTRSMLRAPAVDDPRLGAPNAALLA